MVTNASNIQKRMVDKDIVQKIKAEYVEGKGSIRELSEKYGVGESAHALSVRSGKEKWTKQREEFLLKIERKGLEKAESRVEKWLEKVSCAAESDWQIIEQSLQGLGDQVDPDAILQYVRARRVIDDMQRRALGLADVAQKVDVTSGGRSLEDTLLAVLRQTRQLVSEGKIDTKTIDIESLKSAELED